MIFDQFACLASGRISRCSRPAGLDFQGQPQRFITVRRAASAGTEVHHAYGQESAEQPQPGAMRI